MANEKKNKLVRMKTSEKPQAKIQIIEMTPKDAGKVPLCGHKNPCKEPYQHKFQWIITLSMCLVDVHGGL
jgi:hypothetical protein